MMTSIPFTDPRWTTLNKATHAPKISGDGTEISFPTERETDWWRTPSVDSSSGLVYGFEHAFGEEGFEISVDVNVKPEVQPCPPITSRFTITLKGHLLKVFLNDTPMREVNVFGDGKATSAFIGVLGCSPKSEGALVTFKNFTVKKGTRD
uniref:Glycosyl hydrolase family 32 C-terminal domain-containing protein n=1 Tax=Kwoniella dejecticola CBS 10117 TaxID=1296121 RepID=A0A1A6AFQ8_9TREE|nr:uncharacterized protein I303_00730 [Kwoniella dejecticola CBS 10117]OBR88912.1 hypothetical protein I303_00730 [Kwoniella dejecticola CBS 10117]